MLSLTGSHSIRMINFRAILLNLVKTKNTVNGIREKLNPVKPVLSELKSESNQVVVQ